MTTAQAAEALGVNDSRIRQLLREGTLKGMRVGRDWLVERPEVERLAKERAEEQKRPGRPFKQP